MRWRLNTFKTGVKNIYDSIFGQPIEFSFYNTPQLLSGMKAKGYQIVETISQYHISGNNIQVSLRKGTSDLYVFDEVYVNHDYRKVIQCIKANGLSVHTIVDLGANIGLTAVYFNSYFPEAFVVCVEADKDNAALMLKNVLSIEKKYLINKAVWSKDGQLHLNKGFRDGMDWSISVTEESMGSIGLVEAVTVETVLKETGVEEIDLLKMDIEGSEFEVLGNGNIDFLDHTKILVFELHPESGNKEAIFQNLRSKAFVLFEDNDMVIGIKA